LNSVIEHIDQVTPKWLTSVLEKSGALDQGKVTTINKRQALKLGVSSEGIHLEIGYTDNVSKSAPTNLFLKMGSIWFKSQQKEMKFYRFPTDILEVLPVLRCYDAQISVDVQKSHWLFEDLSKTHFGRPLPFPPAQVNCQQAVECLAKIHTFWWNHPQIVSDTAQDALKEDFKQFFVFNEEFIPHFFDFLGDRLSEKRRKLYEFVLSTLPGLIQKLFADGISSTLVHGDAHCGNFMYPREIGTKETVLLDWQSWHVGPANEDLAYMMAYWWFPERRQALEKKLLTHYHNKLLENGVSNYSWEDCWYLYRAMAILNLFRPVRWHAVELPPPIWWPPLENSFLAFEDLQCLELLS